MEIGAAFIADAQAAELVQPGKGAFDHPAMGTERHPSAAPLADDAHHAVATAHGFSATPIVVAPVDVPRVWAATALSGGRADQGHRVERRFQKKAVVPVRPAQQTGQRQLRGIDDQMVLGARFAPINWTGTGAVAPSFAGMLACRGARD